MFMATFHILLGFSVAIDSPSSVWPITLWLWPAFHILFGFQLSLNHCIFRWPTTLRLWPPFRFPFDLQWLLTHCTGYPSYPHWIFSFHWLIAYLFGLLLHFGHLSHPLWILSFNWLIMYLFSRSLHVYGHLSYPLWIFSCRGPIFFSVFALYLSKDLGGHRGIYVVMSLYIVNVISFSFPFRIVNIAIFIKDLLKEGEAKTL